MLKIVKYLFILLAVILLAGFLYLNTIFKTKAEQIASRMTGTKVSITYASVSPFSGNIVIGGLDVGNPAGFKAKNAIEFSSMSASIDMKTIFKDTVKVTKVELKNPAIYYEIGIRGDNIRKLLSNVKANSGKSGGGTSEGGTSSKKKVVIDDLYLTNCKAELAADLFGLKAGHKFTLGNIHLTNIGSGGNGTSVQNVTALVLQKIIGELAQLKASGIADQLKNIDGGKVGKSLEGVRNLF